MGLKIIDETGTSGAGESIISTTTKKANQGWNEGLQHGERFRGCEKINEGSDTKDGSFASTKAFSGGKKGSTLKRKIA